VHESRTVISIVLIQANGLKRLGTR
jgi:hypothetical protein